MEEMHKQSQWLHLPKEEKGNSPVKGLGGEISKGIIIEDFSRSSCSLCYRLRAQYTYLKSLLDVIVN